MATYNKSQILSNAHYEAKSLWKESIKGTRNKNWAFQKTYAQVFGVCLKKSWENAKFLAEPIQRFLIALAYSDTKKREYAKRLGAKWNPDTKQWSLSCKKSQLGILAGHIVTATTAVSTRSTSSNNDYYDREVKKIQNWKGNGMELLSYLSGGSYDDDME